MSASRALLFSTSVRHLGRDIEQTSFIGESHMNMCRFNCVSAPGHSDFKAALTDYLRIIEARRQSKSDQAQHEEEQREAVKQKGS